MGELFDRVLYAVRVAWLRRNYRHALARIRGRKEARIKVAFLVSDLAKWKGASVFRALRETPPFDPFVAVMNMTRQAELSVGEQRRLLDEKMRFFAARGIPAVQVQRVGRKDTLTIGEIGADIVFYQQPWDLPPQLKPLPVSRRALTFYFPYYTPNYSDTAIEIDHKLHHQVFRHIVCDEATAVFYREARKRMSGAYAGDYLPLGHPALDEIAFEEDPPSADGCVIYAPHWSVDFGDHHPPLRYSTFVETGRAILAYAQAHPEIRWAFKPHPLLKVTLVKSGFMTAAEADDYYAAWESLGEACYDGDYLGLFARSRAMITDCGSFLTEYGCTGKPVIRLVCPRLNAGVQPGVRDLYSTYCNVTTAAEAEAAFDAVLVRGEDPRRADRLTCLQAANLVGGGCAQRIADYLTSLCAADVRSAP